MCGICGFYSKNNNWNQDDLVRMTRSMNHRGPDAEGFYFEKNVGLGHKRLSIIDLSENANQPMHSSCGNYTIIFNGELYNFKQIAKELSIPLKTTSDTEVVLESYAKWGKQCLHKFNGMFAFAILEKENNSLFIARDRIGIKPLCYFWDGSLFAFSSELKALKKLDYINQRLKTKEASIHQFLHLGYIPGPDTIYRDIYKFPPGHYLEYSGSGCEINKYWDAGEQINREPITNEREGKEKLETLLKDSIKKRMISDVPFGTFLSGGIDSSLVTAIAQSLSSKPVNTFSIGFEYGKFDESRYAEKIAGFLGTHHHKYTVTEQEALELIPKLNDIYDEPFADSSAVPTLMVSEIARKHVTMTLSGDGGDELFMGYGAYNWARRLNNPYIKASRKLISLLLSYHNNRSKRAAKLFQWNKATDIRSHIFSQEQYFFTQKEIERLLLPNYYNPISLGFAMKDLKRSLSPEEQQAFFDLNYYLKDDLLVKVDRASMHHSLETRVPLLDHNIAEFALNLHQNLKIKGKTTKYLLKQVLYDYVPESYFNRPKWGFSIPLVKWLKNELYFLQEEYLNEKIVKETGMVNCAEVNKLKFLYNKKNHDYLYNRIWILVVLHKFFNP